MLEIGFLILLITVMIRKRDNLTKLHCYYSCKAYNSLHGNFGRKNKEPYIVMEQQEKKTVNTNEKEEEEINTSEEQEIWSWGAGTDGQLATGNLQDEHSPQFLHSLSAFTAIYSLSCGGAHVIALTLGRKVLTWGRGSSGQLGHGDSMVGKNCLMPMEVKAFESVVITHVSAGWNHSCFVSENGAVFTCGDGLFGQLGHGDYKSETSPKQIQYFASSQVQQVACGMRHSLVLLEENKVYGFGSGKRGQLGISIEKVKSTSLPQITLGLTNIQIASISANGDHSAALSADGSLYTWGRGFGRASDELVPHVFDAPLSFCQIALGWNHALLLTKGKLFMLGGARHGVLGDPQRISSISDESGKSKEDMLQQITELKESNVVLIGAGSEHSALVTDDGRVMTWGWGEHGQLGLGDTVDQTVPQIVRFGDRSIGTKANYRVYCGSGFSFVLSNNT